MARDEKGQVAGRKARTVATAVLLLFLAGVFPATAGEVLVFATHHKPPLSDFCEELLGAILAERGVGFRLELLSGDRVIALVNRGRRDGDASRVGNFPEISDQDASNYVRIDEPIVESHIAMITPLHLKSASASWEEVNKGLAGFLRGSKRIRANVREENRFVAESLGQLLHLVRSGRIRSAAIDRSIMVKYLRENPASGAGLIVHEQPLTSFFLYPYLAPHRAEYRDGIRDGLRRFKRDGTYDRIAARHGIAPWRHPVSER